MEDKPKLDSNKPKLDNSLRKPLGLYLHIPFCVQKCNYCDFLSFGKTDREEQQAYVEALTREIKYYGMVYRNIYYVDSIFIGGGTPSLLEEELIQVVANAINDNFSLSEQVEFTIETNPKTLTGDKLNKYITSGINRLSMGVQSFDESLLKFMGRVHSGEDVIENFHPARECGFSNINLDVMFAVPGQTLEIWLSTLENVIDLDPEHISFYSLQLEEKTPFYSMFEKGELSETSEDLDRSMYHEALRKLERSGYHHYEISNAAKPGLECRHNLKYWSMEDYLGLGLGAHSFMGGARFSNTEELHKYIRIGSEDTAFEDEMLSPYIVWQYNNSKKDNISEYLFTGMRKTDGISLKDFRSRFGTDLETLYGNALAKHFEQDIIRITDGRLHFTEKGIDISNRVLAEFV